MTPQDKAKELVNKFYIEIEDIDCVDSGGWDNARLVEKSVKASAKQCALICVENEYDALRIQLKRLREYRYIPWSEYHELLSKIILEEEQVKTSIQNL